MSPSGSPRKSGRQTGWWLRRGQVYGLIGEIALHPAQPSVDCRHQLVDLGSGDRHRWRHHDMVANQAVSATLARVDGCALGDARPGEAVRHTGLDWERLFRRLV